MIINNLLRKLFTLGKSSFLRQNINNFKKTSQSKNPVRKLILNAILICTIDKIGADSEEGGRGGVKLNSLKKGRKKGE